MAEDDRNKLDALIEALHASPTALKRDWWRGERRKGDLGIRGKFGHICADGDGFLLCVVSDTLSTTRWNSIKCKLAFARLTQDGDSEGCLRLERLPTKAEATIIREALGIRRRRHVSAEVLAALERARASIKSPQIAPAFVQAAPPLPGAA